MDVVIQRTFMSIFGVGFIMGNFGNGLIALVSCMDWVQRRKISSVDHLLTALAISRIGLLWSEFITSLIFAVYPALAKPGKMVKMMGTIWTVINHFNLWLAASLNIFYFLKIANFGNSIFLYLKWRVKRVVLVILLVSLVPLFLHTILINIRIDVWIDELKRNMSYSSGSIKFVQLSTLLTLNRIFLFIPFTVSLMSCLLLIFSLWKHLKKMQHNAAGSRDVRTTAHMKALQTMITFLLLYTILFLFTVVQLCTLTFLQKNQIFLFFHVVEVAFPSVHSWVLILGNSKLRRASHSVLWWLRCRSKDVELSGP